MTNTDNNSKIMVTLPTKYYDILTKLKDSGIVSSYASAVRDALIEWLDGHKNILLILAGDNTMISSTRVSSH